MKTLGRADDREALLRRIEALRPEIAPRWGRMTAHQMVCHVSAALRMATGELPVRLRRVPLRSVVTWLAVWLPVPWPPGIPTSPELDARRLPIQAAFDSDLADLREQIARAGQPPPSGRRPAHPVFGAMSEAAWQRWGYRHLDHHLRQFGV